MNNQFNILSSEQGQRGCVIGGGVDVRVIRTNAGVVRALDKYRKLPTPKIDAMRQLLEPFSR